MCFENVLNVDNHFFSLGFQLVKPVVVLYVVVGSITLLRVSGLVPNITQSNIDVKHILHTGLIIPTF